MTDHIRKAHPDHIALRGIDVRYFGEMLELLKTANKAKVIPLLPMQLMWVMRMGNLANRPEIIDIENETFTIREIEEEGDWNTADGLPPRIEPEPEVLPAIDVEAPVAVFEDDGGYTGPVHD